MSAQGDDANDKVGDLAKYSREGIAKTPINYDLADADRLPPIEVDEPLMLGDDEPTECLDESGCEVGPDIVRAIETSAEKWQALDVDGVSYLVVGASFAVALHKDTDPRNVAALVRRLNTRTEIVRIPSEGDEGLGPITAGFAE